MTPKSLRHDAVVIGGSAGALGPLIQIIAALPEAYPAAVLVVLHCAPDVPGALPEILARSSALPVRHAIDGESIRPGCVYVAPPDRHMIVFAGRLQVVRGPRENRSRPAIDPTLRTAARWFGARMTGVLLSGMLSDGTYGLAVVKACGGAAVVQDPERAEFPAMPRSALERVDVDHVLLPVGIGQLLNESGNAEVESTGGTGEADGLAVAGGTVVDPLEREQHSTLADPPEGAPSPFVCPDCGGALWETHDHDIVRFRCHVGHAYTDDVLLEAQSEVVEAALWGALRALEEKVELYRRLAQRARQGDHDRVVRHHEESMIDAEQQASIVRGVLTSRRHGARRPSSARLDRTEGLAPTGG